MGATTSIKTQLENWYEVLKKVMRMWTSRNDTLKQIKNSSIAKTETDPSVKSFLANKDEMTDADDFYVFLYDQEDKTFTGQA